jgi:hypothetical protein
MMTPKEETNEESNNYGAWFTSAQSLISELPSELSGPSIRQGQEAKGCLGRRPSAKDKVQYKTLRNRGENTNKSFLCHWCLIRWNGSK